MPAPFAALERRVNAAITARLANCEVTAGALSFAAIFVAAGAADLDGLVASAEPRVMAVPADAAAQLQRLSVVAITHQVSETVQTYALAREPEPDDGGTFTLYLRRP